MKTILSKKDSERRQFVLAGDMWRVVMAISLPLAVYNGFNHLFSFVDTMMASHISSEVVSAIAYLSQIKTMLAAIGAGLGVGGGIIVARYYGAGDIKNAKKYVNTVLFLSIGIGLTLLMVMLPFITPILRIANTPEDLISAGSSYFKVEILMIITIFINNVYIAVEKAKGNTKKILYLNLMVIGVKLFLSALFVYVYNFGITMMAVATLIAHLLLTIIGLSNLMHRDNIFRLSFKELDLSMKTIKPIITLSLPIFFERFTFSLGKVIVNSMSAFYGSMVVGALGVSNNIAGIATSVANGFQDGEASIISQNLGNDSFERAIDAFKKTVIISLIIGAVGFLFTITFIDGIISLFARGNVLFAGEIKKILKFEIYALITLTVTSAAMGLLYGFGYTRLSLIINFLRLFLFRIPPLYILQKFTGLGSESVGIAMMISNSMVGIIAITICFIVIQKMRKEGQYNLLIAAE